MANIQAAVDAALNKISFEINLRELALRLSPVERASLLQLMREAVETEAHAWLVASGATCGNEKKPEES